MSRLCLLVALLTLSSPELRAQEYGIDDLAAAFGQAVIVIEANEHACHKFDVFIAESMEQQRRGLMFVRDLPQQSGMLFIYADAGIHSMWMKNTFIPLDIAFIRRDGRISSVARHTEPLSLRSIRSTEPVNFVLELNAGVTDRLFIGPESLV
ncbi:MAG: DUF192 domain-containing protein, partial [Woeseiaceae bacterium]